MGERRSQCKNSMSTPQSGLPSKKTTKCECRVQTIKMVGRSDNLNIEMAEGRHHPHALQKDWEPSDPLQNQTACGTRACTVEGFSDMLTVGSDCM